MGGWPVWLASASFWPPPKHEVAIVTGDWKPDRFRRALALIDGTVLRGLGNPARERVFRMNLTVCKHRAISDAEAEALDPSFWTCQPRHLAGGPIEVLSETEPGSLSTQPCRHPTQERIGNTWLPIDCRACPPCLARMKLESVG